MSRRAYKAASSMIVMTLPGRGMASACFKHYRHRRGRGIIEAWSFLYQANISFFNILWPARHLLFSPGILLW